VEERGSALQTLVGLVDGGSTSPAGMSSSHIKGSAVLGDRDTSVYGPVKTGMIHLDAWMEGYSQLGQEDKVAAFATCWAWCNDTEKRLTMAGLT